MLQPSPLLRLLRRSLWHIYSVIFFQKKNKKQEIMIISIKIMCTMNFLHPLSAQHLHTTHFRGLKSCRQLSTWRKVQSRERERERSAPPPPSLISPGEWRNERTKEGPVYIYAARQPALTSCDTRTAVSSSLTRHSYYTHVIQFLSSSSSSSSSAYQIPQRTCVCFFPLLLFVYRQKRSRETHQRTRPPAVVIVFCALKYT